MTLTIPLATTQKQGMQVSYRPGSVDEIVIKESFEGDKYLHLTPEFTPRKSDTIIDIGAHIGTFCMTIAPLVNKILAFEASAETFDILKKNIEDNQLHNVHINHCAVAKQAGTITLYHDVESGNWGHSITSRLSASAEQVASISLENIIDNEKLEKIDFLKFNCEGAEFEILLHTKSEYLKRIRIMAIQYHENMVEGYTAIGLMKYLRENGFRVAHRYRHKESGNGWITAYKAGGMENIIISIKAFPLAATLFIKELIRKVRRAVYVVRHFGRQ